MSINLTSGYGTSGSSNIASLYSALASQSGSVNSTNSNSGSSSSSSSSSSSNAVTGSSGNTSALAQFQAQLQQQTIGQINGYNNLVDVLSTFSSDMIGVAGDAFSNGLSGVTSSDNSVAYLSPTNSTNYAVSINQLASSQTVVSADQVADPTTALYNTGTLSLQLGTITSSGAFSNAGSPTSITVKASSGSYASLNDVVNAINNAGAGVTASAVKDAQTGLYQLQLAGSASGSNQAFTLTSSDTGSGGTSLSNLNIAPTASAPTIKSAALGTDPTAGIYHTGTLSIQLGSVSSSGSFTPSGTAIPVSLGGISAVSLDTIVSSINSADAGVTASVVTDPGTGNVHLQLVNNSTGTAEPFSITGTNDGSNVVGTDLATLDYTPGTASAGNWTAVTSSAQDASYSVNGTAYTSPSNLGVPVANGINLNLVTTGSTLITIPGTPTAIENTASSLVSTINGLFSVVQQLSSGNGPLASDPTVTTELQSDLTLALNNSFQSGSTNYQSLSDLGISLQSSGTYAIDDTTLASAYTNDPTAVQNILSAVAFALSNLTSNYTGTDGLITTQISNLEAQLPSGALNGSGNVYSQAAQALNNPTTAYNAAAALGALTGGTSGLFG